jgi:MarR family transcriptional regulator for hemolysin
MTVRETHSSKGEAAAPPVDIAAQASLITRLFQKRLDRRAHAASVQNNSALSWVQCRVIASIQHQEGITQREIADRLGVGAVSIGQTIDRLEKSGWVERRLDTADRRVRRLYVSAKALPILAEIDIMERRERAHALKGIAPQDVERLSVFLGAIVENLLSPCR